jgi:uncharacterized protein YdgA (DUF945 family)
LKQKPIIFAAAVLVLAAGYLASSWYFGKRIETVLAEVDAQITTQPWLKVVRHDYERGLLSARDTITVEFSAAAFWPDAEDPETAPAAPPARVTLETSIRHGPLPGFGAPAVASATTVVEFEEALDKKVKEVFGGKPPVEIRTRYGFDGGGRSTIASPPFKITEGSQDTLSSEGLELIVEFARGLAQYSLRGSAPRFEATGADGARLVLSGLTLEGAQTRLFPDEPLLYTGSQKLFIAGLEADLGQEQEQPKFALKDFKYDAQVSASGEFIDVIARFGAAGLTIGDQDHGPAAYDFSMKHLHARKFMLIYRDLMELYARPETLDREGRMRALMPVLSNLGALLLEAPVLSIDRLAFRMPEGEATASASVRFVDVKAEDLMRPWVLIEKIDAEADLALPVTLARTLALRGGEADDEKEKQRRAADADAMIASFAQEAYATIDKDGIFRSRLTFKEGSPTANGKPLLWP